MSDNRQGRPRCYHAKLALVREVWNGIDALGGYTRSDDRIGQSETRTLGKALAIIEAIAAKHDIPREDITRPETPVRTEETA